MEHRRVGTSELEVSRIVLGGMSFGDPVLGAHPWSLPLDDSRPIIRHALEAGITTFDTANSYSAGSGEEILGTVLKESAKRDEIQIATKVYGRMAPGPDGAGLGRKHILGQIDESLRRLKTDYVDLYQIHRWDPSVAIEETMETLHEIVTSGKARFIGASSMFAWQFAKAQYTADLGGWTRFVSMQDQYNLLSREDEREMHPYCLDAGVGVIPWSPLARGRLTRDWGAVTERSTTDEFGTTLYRQDQDADHAIVDAVASIARAKAVPRAQVALAWLLHRPVVTAPIVGATKLSHVDDAVAALDVKLSADDIAALESPYTPRAYEGF